MKKISVCIAHRHQTSISLEIEFYNELIKIAAKENKNIDSLVTEIDKSRTTTNLSSAIRIFILNNLKQEINKLNSK